jgi:hypothetical protein
MSPIRHKERVRRHRTAAIIAVVSTLANVAYVAASLYHIANIRHPYHTSLLSGPAWVCELLLGNAHRI